MRSGALLLLLMPAAAGAVAPATSVAPAPAVHVHGHVAPAQTAADIPAALAADDAMAAMGMHDDARYGKLVLDRVEWTRSGAHSGQDWEMHGWYGGDFDRLLVRSEGERAQSRLQQGDLELLWSHAVAAFWDSTLGVRHDFGAGPRRDWLALGVQGIAPYWFELEATAYLGAQQRSALRLRSAYTLRLSQRLILLPELEINAYGRSDRARRIGSGLSDGSFGLRLRYELRREFAPYVGVVWRHAYGATALLQAAAGEPARQRLWVAGLRLWF